MFRFVGENGNLFGLSYRNDAFVGRETPPGPGSVGCVARIQAVMPLEKGRMNIISIGVVRYRIVALNQTEPFVLARAEAFTDDVEGENHLLDEFADLREQCKEFLAAAQTLDESTSTIDADLPEEPEAFSLLIASALPIDNDAKQTLLEITSTRLRLTRLRRLVANALAEYNQRIEIRSRAKQNGHGKLS